MCSMSRSTCTYPAILKKIPLPILTDYANRGDEIKKKSSPVKLLSQSQPNFAEMILGWPPSKIMSGISDRDGRHSQT